MEGSDSELPSPAFCIDLDRLEGNTAAMLALASAQGLYLRPHVKTSKSIEVALLMVRRVSRMQLITIYFQCGYSSNSPAHTLPPLSTLDRG